MERRRAYPLLIYPYRGLNRGFHLVISLKVEDSQGAEYQLAAFQLGTFSDMAYQTKLHLVAGHLMEAYTRCK